ncbi:uncharacterized protein LOC111889754 [Lactuca sativa]|uniref:Transmembrane protein n=1 Tax=Lactuca sativa TaxID=4236 RepID=A0A9R1UDB2_LACSA|nr:uncharacterized protein LOC111889754 [Lactuca sativa]KAJ0185075.1 hypothetical protein LSAT_V11C900497780 [Lactuca sativa]
MENMSEYFKKGTPKTYFIKLNNIFSIFIFIFIFSSFVSLCSYTHHFSSFDRHYIFLLCNGILVFLIMNFDPNHVSSPKEIQSVVTSEINHPPLLIPSDMEPIAAVIKEEEEQQQIKNEDNEIEQVENEVFVFGDHNSLSVMHDQSEYQKAENLIAFIDEQETVESKEAAETKELNKKCAEFITKMRERMRLESSSRHTLVLQT